MSMSLVKVFLLTVSLLSRDELNTLKLILFCSIFCPQ